MSDGMFGDHFPKYIEGAFVAHDATGNPRIPEEEQNILAAATGLSPKQPRTLAELARKTVVDTLVLMPFDLAGGTEIE